MSLFSVLMSVYAKEKTEYFVSAMDSILSQTLKPDEIVLVRDGAVSEELQAVIDRYLAAYGELFKYIPLDENVGLGNALRIGVEATSHELIARMDTDDIALPDRFELQMAYMDAHPDVSLLGGQIAEFIDSPEQPVSIRKVPCEYKEICQFLKKRNAFNHMTVVFRKSAVLKAGNYLDLPYMEDYFLWCRMYLSGENFANMPRILVKARIGADMYRRRGGYAYFKSWKKFEDFKLKQNITSRIDYIKTLSMRFVVHVLLPNQIRGWILKTFSRSKK